MHVLGLSGNGQELGLLILGFELIYFFLFSALCFKDKFLREMTVFGVMVALHIGTFNESRAYKSHCF